MAESASLLTTQAVKSDYTAFDAERFEPEVHTGVRSDFARDRARVLHSSAWRRLAAKTQVLSPTSGIDFARNRLTHSLEVAQVGRELAVSLGLDQEIVDTACLAHDLGHPPFGHNGERALNEWMAGFGGFEGNAQTLRILTRLEPKRFDSEGRSVGLNLTRATLDASCKYPWSLDEAPAGSSKFDFEEELAIFEWLRDSAPARMKCAEAQIMDFSDDVAYSVHDFEDAIVSEHIDPQFLAARSGHEALIRIVSEWSGGTHTTDELAQAFDRMAASLNWPSHWGGTRKDQAMLKNFTSDMIGRFARAAIQSTLEIADGAPLARYGAQIVIPQEVTAEIAVLKGIVAAFVMQSDRRQPVYRRQRSLLIELMHTLWESGAKELEPAYAADFRAAKDEATARRAVADQVASLTDQSAIAWYDRLCTAPLV